MLMDRINKSGQWTVIAKITTGCCEIYRLCISKMYDSNSTIEREVNGSLLLEILHYTWIVILLLGRLLYVKDAYGNTIENTWTKK